MNITRRLLAALFVTLIAVAMSSTASSPAGADPSYIQLPVASQSPQYQVNGCRYKIVYLNYGAVPIAALRTYYSTAAACVGASVAVQGQSGATKYWYWHDTANGYSEGIDGCGAYRNIQAIGVANRYAVGAIAALPSAPGGGWFNGWRFYGNDGTANQNSEFVQDCSD
ncbi:MAG TPA: hypothetical protein VEW93_00530 [Acidimicrobiales bacterium]|nr:hypothetical protein [Acidimicrobiales bacterium]